MRRLCIVPRWSGGPESDFYPWLLGNLGTRLPPPFGALRALSMPTPDTPLVSEWSRAVSDAIGDDPLRSSELVLVGHSVGCQAILHALAMLPPGMVGGALLVAGWFTVDRPWETLQPWLEAHPDLEAARAACSNLMVLLSDNDPFTADVAANRKAWEDRMGAEVRVVPGAKHFNAPEEPAVLEALLERFG